MTVPDNNPASGAGASAVDAPTEYERIQATPEFQNLRRTFRGFVFPLTAFFLIWYFAYVILAAWFPGFMSIQVYGLINVGLLFGLAQFVTTFGITIWYMRWTSRTFDPRADEVREMFNNDTAGGARA